MSRSPFLAAWVALFLLVNVPSRAQESLSYTTPTGLCGPLENAFGPFDYRTAAPRDKRLVEGAHFTPEVETLRRGSRGYLGGDIDYTLRVFPNHPRALMAMVRLAELKRTTRPAGARYTAECYFDRAIRFTPDDPMVRVLYGIYLAKARRTKEAEEQLSQAEQLGGSDPQVIYDIGIGHLELKDYAKALAFAKKADAMGIRVTGLRDRLQREGQWPH